MSTIGAAEHYNTLMERHSNATHARLPFPPHMMGNATIMCGAGTYAMRSFTLLAGQLSWIHGAKQVCVCVC